MGEVEIKDDRKRFTFTLGILDKNKKVIEMIEINSQWSAVSEGFLKKYFNLDTHNETTNVISTTLKESVTPEFVKDLMEVIKWIKE